jgi:hypothetical protein
MSRQAKYGVKFVGYSADVIARKHGREIKYANLDFVTGGASVWVEDCGLVMVPKRVDLGPFVRSLPNLASELGELLCQRVQALKESGGTGTPNNMVSLSYDQNKILVAPETNVNRFIRQITKRFIEIEQVLEQAEQIGSRINRRPYSEYIDEIAKTGMSRVEGHGFALFVDGRLIFYPRHQVVLVKQQRPNLFQLFPLDEAPKINSRPN